MMSDNRSGSRKSMRLKGYDYSQSGQYFVTLCCHNRLNHFGEVINNEMVLNQYGKIAGDEWLSTPQIRRNVLLDVFVIMPNHIHAILILNEECRGDLHSPLSNQSTIPVFLEQQLKSSNFHAPSQTISAVIRGYKSSVTKQVKACGFDEQLWQRGYHDHIIRNEQSYNTISDYIINNPVKWEEDRFFTK